MFRASTCVSRNSVRPGFLRSISLSCTILLIVFVPVVAGAYTVVLRSGRQIDIPSEFVVTARTLTYEVSPGINVTLLLSSIDISATERANNEVAGSLLGREKKLQGDDATTAGSRPRRRELSQMDIEKARLARDKSEQAYERRRKELGLPSMEEFRLRTQQETQRIVEAAREDSARTRESEAYWRARANDLRGEILSLDSQITYVRARISELPDYPTLAAYALVSDVAPVFPVRHAVTTFPLVTGNPGFLRGPYDTRVLGPGYLGFGSSTFQGRMQTGTGASSSRRWSRVAGRRLALTTSSAFGIGPFGQSYQRDNLIVRLRELETARAGLEARWRLLEEEARRSGAQPGWLRP